MDQRTDDLPRRLEQLEVERDALALQLARLQEANAERVPAAVVRRLAAGETPLRVWREHRGLSLRGLAATAGISPAMLSEMETGKKEGSGRTLLSLARAGRRSRRSGVLGGVTAAYAPVLSRFALPGFFPASASSPTVRPRRKPVRARAPSSR